ncbi:MAG: hypothetical protein K0R93_935 [Anaerosolibacter sp.]|jgi:hypothetical protein|uniref:DUF4397 domain-containing protein n=1 Tax=Anaerosolibacter sp. TaxID=1872527 RepID=UPI00260F2929|nr:DUF4397 domain-containing protein [Anaerosolibacter sp.]MDF2546037.1 hypothetical protein [Anaerosolibacter sp.]
MNKNMNMLHNQLIRKVMIYLYFPQFPPYMYRMAPIPSYVRILHASPDAPAVDVYANGNRIAQNLTYKNFTPYLPLTPGRYSVLVYPAGTRETPVINTSLDVMPNASYTVAAVGMLKDIKALVVPDTALPLPPNRSQIKFVHLSPNAPMVDLTTSDGTILFRNIEFKEISNNLTITSGRYTIQARIAGTTQVVLTVPNVVVQPDKYYTIYAVGLVDQNPPLQVLIALDKASY